MRRVAQVIDLGHARHPPAGHAGDEIGDPGLAFPEALVRALQALDHAGDHLRVLGLGDVPDLMRLVAEHAQHVDRVAVALRQLLAVADAHHLGTTRLVGAGLARDVGQVFRMMRVGHVDDRRAVVLVLAGQRVERLLDLVGAAVMADIGDPARALVLDDRLIGAARLQVAVTDQRHVLGIGGIADLRRILRNGRGGHGETERGRKANDD
jgi:hypothetical protein